MPYFQTEDTCRLYYECHGFEAEKPVVVFLNGMTQTVLNWLPQAKAFKKQFRAILYDARGQGKSDLGGRSLSPGLHAADLIALLNALKLKKVHLVGLSHGAHVALTLTAEAPQRVERLVLCGIGANRSSRAEAVIRSWLATLKNSGLEAMVRSAMPVIFGYAYLEKHSRILDKIVRAIVLRNRETALAAHLSAMLAYPNPSDSAMKITHPCLVISADADPLVNPQNANRLEESCGGTDVLINGSGLTLTAESPVRFNRCVLAFLEKELRD